MSNIYNSQLDAFDLYHKVREIAEEEYRRSHGDGDLPPVGHAVAGSVASALSNAITYPLDLMITRLQTQRRLQNEESTSRQDEYQSLLDAATKIYKREGGLGGFYAGIFEDTAKTVLDSFLFFLLYNFLRQKRLARFAKTHNGKTPSLLPAFDELGIGFIAGSLTRLVTTPISNIVTRKQTGAMASSRSSDPATPVSAEKGANDDATKPAGIPTTSGIAREIYAEKGLTGFFAGYSATLFLTLNPSLTFFLFEASKRVLLPRSKRENPPPSATFLLAAFSKAMASSVTYPFQLAKARMQASGGQSASSSNKRTTILHALLTIVSEDGVSSLYEGLVPEVLKGFLSHGLTMLLKQSVHNTVLQLYLALSHLVTSLGYSISGSKSRSKTTLRRLRQQGTTKNKEYYDMAIDRVGEVAETTATRAAQLKDNVTQTARSGAGTALEKSGNLMNEVMQMANETAELVRDYIDDEGDGGGEGV